MYGTIAKLTVKPGSSDQIHKLNMDRRPAGFVGSYVFKSDNNENEYWLVAIFQDKETYFANAESPEQDAEFMDMMKMMAAEPEWHDGEIIIEDHI